MQDEDPARLVVLEELRRSAIATYGEERAAESLVQSMLRAAATAVWRLSLDPLEPGGDEP